MLQNFRIELSKNLEMSKKLNATNCNICGVNLCNVTLKFQYLILPKVIQVHPALTLPKTTDLLLGAELFLHIIEKWFNRTETGKFTLS